LKNNQSLPNSISHKELNKLLKKASPGNTPLKPKKDFEITDKEEFNQLLCSWSDTSNQLLSMLRKKKDIVTKDRKSESIMALGAMSAHLNMALQAMKVIELDN